MMMMMMVMVLMMMVMMMTGHNHESAEFCSACELCVLGHWCNYLNLNVRMYACRHVSSVSVKIAAPVVGMGHNFCSDMQS